jgi:aspartokinase-like uncharacterized kinase
MDAVIKVGGSLAENPAVLRDLCKKLDEIGEQYRVLVVPGGGKFADAVREVDMRYSLKPCASHRMAILGMDQFGLLLSELIPNSCVIDSLYSAKRVWESKKVPVLLPSKLMLQEDPLPASWGITSDSIAAHIAHRLDADKLILVTDVDGIFTSDPKTNLDAKLIGELSATELLKMGHRTSVDLFLPKLLLEKKLDCYVVNGAHPSRIRAVLRGEKTVCTFIAPKKGINRSSISGHGLRDTA